MTFIIMTLSKIAYLQRIAKMTLSITTLWHYADCRYHDCHYVECRTLSFIMLKVIMLSVAFYLSFG